MRAELFHGKMLTLHADCLLEDIACVLLAQTKDEKIVCVIRCQITRTWIHTSLKGLASARHNNGRKSCLPIECTLQTKQSLKTKKRMMYSPGALLYCGRTGSDVICCCRPTSCVFLCMLQTRVTLMAFPIEDAVQSSHEGEQTMGSETMNWQRTVKEWPRYRACLHLVTPCVFSDQIFVKTRDAAIYRF